MKAIRFISFGLLVILLTALSQIGGVVLLLCIPVFRWIDRHFEHVSKLALKLIAFVIVYSFFSVAAVPPVALLFNRVPLPVFSNAHLKPLNILSCALNRHYVDSALKNSAERAAVLMSQKHPGTVISYLDACFPFIDGFPLLPHLSHNDGQKLDLALFYLDSKSQEELQQEAPSPIGYGVYVQPKPSEQNQAFLCAEKGYWQYSALQYVVPQWNKDDYLFDETRTKSLVNVLAADESIAKIFIEPHLVARLQLNQSKIRFHGCRAVRHDDHIHIQLK